MFEAIGVPGILNDILKWAPARTKVTVVGVCMEPDTIMPFFAISKEIDMQFCLGLRPDGVRRFAALDRRRRDRRAPDDHPRGRTSTASPTRSTPLGDPEQDCKILVVPAPSASPRVGGMPSDFQLKTMNVVHRALIKVSFGKVGWDKLSGMPALELTTVGRKSGQKRSVMLTSPVQEGDNHRDRRSRGGDPTHPAWFLNLRDNPKVEVSFKGGPKPSR